MADILEIRSVSAAYGRIQAIADINLRVPEGAIVALLGANGAGKTTTLNTVSRLVPVTSGSILFEGRPIERATSHAVVRAGISQVPEGREVFREMSIRENLDMGAYGRSDRAGVRDDIERAFDYFPILKERIGQKAGTLSGGEQQMLVIARALMARPRLLLLDEPSLGLSPLLVEKIFSIIRRLNEGGLSILLVEQNAFVALGASRYAYILENGEVAIEGASAALREDDAVRRSYIG
jgi:branched-chain amino acid transport system ATP-binding protein